MKKIYWFIQKTEIMGGTEIVTINLINLLSKYYDITLVVAGKKNEDLNLKYNNKIVYLDIPLKHLCLDLETGRLKKEKKYLLIPFSAINTVFFWTFRRFKYRKLIRNITDENDLLIASSWDNYVLVPRGRKAYFHFHFNAKFFNSIGIRLSRTFHRKPDKYIFLTKATADIIKKKHKRYANSCYVHNPCRYDCLKNVKFNDNKIIFIGRYTYQKNPILALNIAKELKDMDVYFHMNFYGDGILENEINNFILKHELNNFVSVNHFEDDIEKELLSSDLLLVTSKYEGFPLVTLEANSFSVPVITSNWGDAVNEIVENDINGYIINKDDPKEYANIIKALFENKNRLLDLKEKTVQYAIKFSSENIINKWQKILDESFKM